MLFPVETAAPGQLLGGVEALLSARLPLNLRPRFQGEALYPVLQCPALSWADIM